MSIRRAPAVCSSDPSLTRAVSSLSAPRKPQLRPQPLLAIPLLLQQIDRSNKSNCQATKKFQPAQPQTLQRLSSQQNNHHQAKKSLCHEKVAWLRPQQRPHRSRICCQRPHFERSPHKMLCSRPQLSQRPKDPSQQQQQQQRSSTHQLTSRPLHRNLRPQP